MSDGDDADDGGRFDVGKRTFLRGAGVTLGALGLPGVAAARTRRNTTDAKTVGPNQDGTAVNSHGWTLTPAGDQTTVGDRPMGTALTPNGRYLAVTNDGQGVQSVMVIDTRTEKVVDTVEYPAPEALFVGLAFSHDGKRLYASAGGNDKIRVYDHREGSIVERDPIKLDDSSDGSYFPAGLAVSPAGDRLFVANNLDDSVAVIDLASEKVDTFVNVGSHPYTVAFDDHEGKAYVSNWGTDTLSVLDTASTTVTGTITVGSRPNDVVASPTRSEMYVANANVDTVSVVDTRTDEVTGTVDLAPYPDAPVGSMPDALAVSQNGKTLYVANAGNNDVAVVDLGHGHATTDHTVTGLIPTAWFPSALSLAPNGKTLYVANMKGLGAGPNPNGPNPTKNKQNVQYIGNMIDGTVSTIAVPDGAELVQYTQQVVDNNGFDERTNTQTRPPSQVDPQPVPERVGDPSPIEHVIYVIKENRTYDQVFGSLDEGNGDASLTLFGEKSAPNQRELAREFTLFDNFYTDAEVSADGHNWSTAAIANDYVQKTWPANYSGRNRPYDYENANTPANPGSYIWNEAAAEGVSYRDYGEFTFGGNVNAPGLQGHTDTDYVGFDLSYSDQKRMDEFLTEFRQYEKNGGLPQLSIVRLPNDHTAGTTPGMPTPRAMMADNDLALGRLVEAVTHSDYWEKTAIFVVEDDAQNGPDHVDAHRSLAHVISPYTRRNNVDSTFYNTVAVLRTMELILGLPPMTQFDAAATPMVNAFQSKPDTTPYEAITPEQPLDELNTTSSPDAQKSKTLDLKKADQAPMQEFNRIVWHAVKGEHSDMPKPHTRFRTAATPGAALASKNADGSGD